MILKMNWGQMGWLMKKAVECCRACRSSFICFVYPSINQSLKRDLLLTYSRWPSACSNKVVVYRSFVHALLSVKTLFIYKLCTDITILIFYAHCSEFARVDNKKEEIKIDTNGSLNTSFHIWSSVSAAHPVLCLHSILKTIGLKVSDSSQHVK